MSINKALPDVKDYNTDLEESLVTIKALYSNTVELMQVAVNEFCEKYLHGNRYLRLTVEKL